MGDFLDYNPEDQEPKEIDEETEQDENFGDFLDDPNQEDDFEESLEEMDEEERALKLVERRQEKNRLKKILKTAPWRFYPHLTLIEQNFLRKMKKKGHGNEVRAIESAVDLRKQAFKMKANTALTTGAPFTGYIALGILIIILVVVIVATIMPWLFPDDENGGGGKGAASPFGMKGDMFYGGRVVYRDAVLSQNGLIEQYVDIVKDTVNNLKGKVYTNIDVSGESYDIKVEIDITTDDAGLKLPAEEFNYEELVLTDFATDYAKLYQIVCEIAKICYKVDNNADAPADLTETLNGIKYFGFNGDMIGESIDDTIDNVMEVVYNGLTQSGVISLQEKLSTETEYNTAKNVTFDKVKDNLKTEVENTIDVETNKIQTEKLFIKDIILDGDDKYMEGIEKKNYVALIYLPKQSVEFDYISYMITIDKDAEFSMVLSNNGSEISLTKDNGEDLSSDYEQESNDLTYVFKSKENLNQTVTASDIVNNAELDKFYRPCSLFNIVKNSSDYTTYLQGTTLENGDTVLTYKTGNMFILFETDAEFYFSEEIKY